MQETWIGIHEIIVKMAAYHSRYPPDDIYSASVNVVFDKRKNNPKRNRTVMRFFYENHKIRWEGRIKVSRDRGR